MSQLKHYVPEIQGLRAIAILVVVLFHAEIKMFSGGFVGVDVFFVISGYLIMGLLLREYGKNQEIDLAKFFARRIKRLLPASFFVLIITMLVFSAFYSAFETKLLTSSAIASLLYLSNIWFATISTDYLRGDADTDPFLHMWSLATEEQFYLFWPLLFIASYKFARKPAKIWPAIFFVVCLSFLLNVLLVNTNQPWAFFGAPTRAWEFGLGALCWVLASKNSFRLGYVESLVGTILGLLLVCYAVFFFGELTLFPGYNALFPVVGTVLILLCITTGHSTPLSMMLASGPARFIGDISYALYLWHWPVNIFFKETYPNSGVVAVIVSVIVSFFFAVLTTRCVFHAMPATHSMRCRPPIPRDAGH